MAKTVVNKESFKFNKIFRALILLAALSPFAALLPAGGPVRGGASEKITILKVVDGDTLTIDYRGARENIRLIGIDTPESFAGKKARRDSRRSHKDISEILSSGKAAAAFTRKLAVAGDNVTVEFDVEKRDRYGRLLGYVFLADGRMLNEEIIKNGYASVLTVPPNVRYQERFLEAYRHARRNGLGLWKE